MSSILDALKKVERESTADRGAGTPWPAPLSAPPSYRQRTRRLWIPLGIVVGLCISGTLFWQSRRHEIARPEESMTVMPSPNRSIVKTSPSAAEQKQIRPPSIISGDPPKKTTVNQPAAMVQETSTTSVAPPRPPEIKPSLAAAPDKGPKVRPSPAPQVSMQPPAVVSTAEPVAAAEVPVSPSPKKRAAPGGQPADDSPETAKVFRNDPRIDLQALVWAPETTGRFVVINNRLIKEGGAVDNILVVRINPDDVLLAEGSDQWHEAFTIR